jgi:hypothetical protein
MIVLVPVSVGELVDKITILEIKCDRLKDPAKLINVKTELLELMGALGKLELPDLSSQFSALREVNGALWDIEDFKRSCEKSQNFGQDFVDAARQVYIKNDKRAQIKKEINAMCGSSIVEEKSYE